jgi:hypothetical protein
MLEEEIVLARKESIQKIEVVKHSVEVNVGKSI